MPAWRVTRRCLRKQLREVNSAPSRAETGRSGATLAAESYAYPSHESLKAEYPSALDDPAVLYETRHPLPCAPKATPLLYISSHQHRLRCLALTVLGKPLSLSFFDLGVSLRVGGS